MSALAIATLALSGVLLGPAPQPARAALVATGVNDSQTVKHDRPATIPAPGVLGNDLNLLGGTSANLVSGVSHGTLALQSDGGYTYTPAAGYLGTDTFRYRPSGLLSTGATVTITITNATPVARPDAYWAGATIVVAAPGVLANDTDADGDALVAERLGGGSGSLDLDPNGGFRYSPGGGSSGTATFSYRVWDGLAWSPATTIRLTVAAPSPTPAPTATPSPTPTTPILPLPIPSLPLPSLPLPSLPLPPLPLPSQPQPSGSPFASPSPNLVPGTTASPASSAIAAPRPSGSAPTPSGSAEPAPPASTGTGGGPAAPQPGASIGIGGGDPESRLPSIGFDERRLDLAGLSVGLFGGMEIWAVPAATIALPGLLVLLWVALQAAGAIAWIPAVRRLRGEDDARRRARSRTPGR